MKRFLLFVGVYYYPGAGWQDYCGSYRTEEEAKAAAIAKPSEDWVQIVDSDIEKVVLEGRLNGDGCGYVWKTTEHPYCSKCNKATGPCTCDALNEAAQNRMLSETTQDVTEGEK